MKKCMLSVQPRYSRCNVPLIDVRYEGGDSTTLSWAQILLLFPAARKADSRISVSGCKDGYALCPLPVAVAGDNGNRTWFNVHLSRFAKLRSRGYMDQGTLFYGVTYFILFPFCYDYHRPLTEVDVKINIVPVIKQKTSQINKTRTLF